MRRILAISVLVIVLAAIGWARYWNSHTGENPIVATGTIEATEVDISPKVAGRIERILVDEADRVTEGQLLAELEHQELGAQVRMAEGQVAAARARLKNLEAGSREQEIKRAEAIFEEAQANLEKSRLDLNRADQLYKDKLVSDQEWEQAKTAYDVAVAKQREAKEALDLLKAGTRSEVIQAARGELNQAQAALDLAVAQLGNTRLTAPLAATVLLKNHEQGEMVVAGTPILTLGDLQHLWVTIYVKETELGRIKLGQEAKVSVDTFPGKKYRAKISYISNKAEFTPKTIQTQEERVKLVFRIKVAIENQNDELKPGLPADVELLSREEKG